ncbi:Shedu immune nuclease family protein [Aquamicrobium terrae]|uniref:Shedu protein SduA C-terminal domain-containing protein n=1 Tax=Aquamicrobium terrae TaxID=1324945 RepID=A0ABV2N0B7_9HYPH
MATFGPQFGDDDQGTMAIEPKEPGVTEVYFRPSDARLRAVSREKDVTARVRLLRFDANRGVTTLYPVNTMPTSSRFLEPKHDPILSIELALESSMPIIVDDFDDYVEYVIPKTLEDVQLYLNECMPSGFIKDPNFGLGIDRTLSFIPWAIAQIEGVEQLRLTDKKQLEVSVTADGKTFEMGYALFDNLRLEANRSDEKARVASRKRKKQSAYTNLLTRHDPERFPLKLFDRDQGDIAEAIGPTIVDAKLSTRDREAVVSLAAATVRTSLPTQRARLIKLHDEIELAALDELIDHMQVKLAAHASEAQWQKLFEANPLILDLVFNVPVVLLQGQAHVGGKRLSGAGETITDFLFANQITDNVAVLEIKTPATPLLNPREYRGGVFRPSSELTGGVAQILDQINHLQTAIAAIRHANRSVRIESYGIRGVLLAGTIPASDAHRRSYELYRNALFGVSVITFDELLAKLKSLRELLWTNANR